MDNIGNTEHALTFADLRVHYYTGRSYLISGEGRDIDKFPVKTKILTCDLLRQLVDIIEKAHDEH